MAYPEIWQTVSAESKRGFLPDPIWQALSANFAEAIPKTMRKSLNSKSTAAATPRTRESAARTPERLPMSSSSSHGAELMDDSFFVSKYQLELPQKEEIQWAL